MKSSRKLPHFQQINSDSCGAACIQMLLNSWGIDASQKEIWEEVKIPKEHMPGYYCGTGRMVEYLLEKGIICSVISTEQPIKLLEFCQSNNLEAVIMYHRKSNIPAAHFSVFSYKQGNSIFINDPLLTPLEGINRRINSNTLINLMQNIGEHDDIKRNNTFLVLSPPNSNPPVISITLENNGNALTFPLIQDVALLSNAFYDFYCDIWRPITIQREE